MADCECTGFCNFFERHQGSFGPVEQILIRQLCHGGGEQCARHIVYARVGADAVPKDLFPCDVVGAERIVEQAAS